MGINQILIRLGVDGSSIRAGLTKAGAYFKSWTRELMHGLKEEAGSFFKGFIGAEAVRRMVDFTTDQIREVFAKVNQIKRDSQATGLGTNFIQGLYEAAEKAGIPFEALEKNLRHFSAIIGQAKNGSKEATDKLVSYGVVTKGADVQTLNLEEGLNKLRAAHISTADATVNNAREADLLGKGYQNLLPVLRMTAEQFEEMGQSNFFAKLTPQTIALFTGAFGAKATAGSVMTATAGNLITKFLPQMAALAAGGTSTGVIAQTVRWAERLLTAKGSATVEQEKEFAAQQESLQVEEQRADTAEKLLSLTERQAELQGEIADRDKQSVKEMADRARHLLGQRGPLERSHTVTARMRQALQIDNLEQRATLAWQKGDDAQAGRLQGQADQMRQSSTFLKLQDQNPMAKTESELKSIGMQLDVVQDAAKLILKGDQN